MIANAGSSSVTVGRRIGVGGLILHAAFWIGFLPALAGTPAVAQSLTATTPATGSYRIAGTITNAATGEPVPRATVAVLDEKDSNTVESVVSDSNGRFALERLAAAKYQLTASKRGFRTGFYDQHDEYNSAIVTGPDQDTEHLVFRLAPNATLRGVVTGDGGDVVEGARILLFQVPRGVGRDFARARGPQNSVVEIDAVTTDDTGAYEFGNLDAGEYLLAVKAEPWYALDSSATHSRRSSEGNASNDERSALDVAYPVTYYDSTTDESSATPITLTEGQREEANINLHAVPALHLSIDVPHKPGGGIARPELRQAIFGTQVSAESAGFIDALQTGVVEIGGVAPGHYVLWQGDPPRAMNLDATDSGQVDTASAAPAVNITGTLRTNGGEAVPDGANVFLYLMEGPLNPGPMQALTQKGQFRFENVPPGTWELSAWNADFPVPILSVSANGTMHAGGTFTVADRPLAITATAALGSTRIEGLVRRDGKGAPGALVVLMPRNTAAFEGLVRRDQTDSDGSFSLRDVAPGEYTLVAIEGAWDLDRAGPEALDRYLPKGVAVTVKDISSKLMRLSEPVAAQPH